MELSISQARTEKLYFRPPNEDIIFISAGIEVMRLDKNGMIYKGQRIEDAGVAHKVFLEVFTGMREAG